MSSENTGDGCDFGAALKLLKSGHKVAREGWNGKGMYLYLVPANTYKTVTEVAKKEHGEEFEAGAYITMKPASGPMVIGWLASQADMLSEDWRIVT